MSTQATGQKLIAAAMLIEQALDLLDPNTNQCPCCGLAVHGDITAYRLRSSLIAVPEKLRRLAYTTALKGNEP
jgi:hypothetical protein